MENKISGDASAMRPVEKCRPGQSAMCNLLSAISRVRIIRPTPHMQL